ncbi:MAG: Si-specific NAD(P)(+) transhydrogenase [Deltaproteobacteria bacterium]|nr:Si-specific NAD(P)(+) transhydrogenase [Deltaproteobacteria bacterium]
MQRYDVLVIGSGPGGQKAAIQAAKLGKKVAIIERSPFVGGAGIHTGTLPSKTLRETALFFSGFKQRAVFGSMLTLGRDVALGELMHRKTEVMRKQMETVLEQFTRNDVEMIYGEASFVDEHTLQVNKGGGEGSRAGAGVIVIAAGTSPARPPDVPFDSEHIHDSDTILKLDRIPNSMTVIGGGVIGCEYACIFAALGVKINLVERKPGLLSFADEEMVTSLMYWMRHSGVTLRLGEEVVGIRTEGPGRVVTGLKSGKKIVSEKLLYTMGRVGNTGALNLEAIGMEPGERGLLKVNGGFQTAIPHIYAIGDVIGFPSLASTSMEQGRRAVCNAFQKEGVTCEVTGHLPFGIYTIPEISMVGETEEGLTQKAIPYEVGCAYFQDVARGQIIGEAHGMVKLIFHRETRRLLGVHIVGEKASELIHIGQAVLNYGGPVDYFKDAVFNYPTLTDAYKEAALNGINKL